MIDQVLLESADRACLRFERSSFISQPIERVRSVRDKISVESATRER